MPQKGAPRRCEGGAEPGGERPPSLFSRTPPGPRRLPPRAPGLIHDTERQGFVIDVGPVDLPTSAFLWRFSWEIVGHEGRELLHHLDRVHPHHRELFLPISQRLLAVGRETATGRMPWLPK